MVTLLDFNHIHYKSGRTTLYRVINSTTGKYCSVAFIWIVTLKDTDITIHGFKELKPPCTALTPVVEGSRDFKQFCDMAFIFNSAKPRRAKPKINWFTLTNKTLVDCIFRKMHNTFSLWKDPRILEFVAQAVENVYDYLIYVAGKWWHWNSQWKREREVIYLPTPQSAGCVLTIALKFKKC